MHANGYVPRVVRGQGPSRELLHDRVDGDGLREIGLGVALAVPDRSTVVFDGDGNLLMSLGILPMIGGGPVMGPQRPANLVHVVFDNALYGSNR